jgi:hypothetical protein
MLTTRRKKVVGDKKGEDDGEEALDGAGAVDGGGLDQGFGDRLHAGEEEEEVVGDLLPGGGEDHQQHGLIAVDLVVPGDPGTAQPPGDDADRGVEEEEPEDAGNGRGHGVGPDEQGFVGQRALDDVVGHGGEQQGHGEAEDRHADAEDGGDADRAQIFAAVEEEDEIVEPDEADGEAERVLDQHRLPKRLARGPDEEDQRDGELRGEQQVGQPAVAEDDALFHGLSRRQPWGCRGTPMP